MNIFYTTFKAIIAAGPVVLLPIIIFVLALIFRVKLANAFRSAITIGVGFAGLKLVIAFLQKNLGPAAKAMVDHYHLHLDVLDLGYPTAAAVGWSSSIVGFMVLAILFTNVIALLLKRTNTLSVDLWNYHHSLTTGALVFFATKSFPIAIMATVFSALVGFKLCDWASPYIHRYYKIEGVTTPAFSALTGFIFTPINIVIDKIPYLNKINFNIESIQKRFGIFGEPIMLGLILGMLLGFLAGFGFLESFGLGINMSAAMILLPKMTHMFVEALKPISEKAKDFTTKRFKGRKILIGLDPSMLLGDPTVITTALIMVPITIFLAIIIPFNHLLPFADLGAIGFKMALIVAVARGNLFRTLIIAIVYTIATLICGTITAPLMTAAAHSVGVGTTNPGMISSLTGPAMPLSFLILETFLKNLYISVPTFIIIFGIIWIYMEKRVLNKNNEFRKEKDQRP